MCIRDRTKGEMNDIDPVILSYCLIGIANFTALKFIEFDNKNNYEEVVEEVMKLSLIHIFFAVKNIYCKYQYIRPAW